jgi:hypothetical protein
MAKARTLSVYLAHLVHAHLASQVTAQNHGSPLTNTSNGSIRTEIRRAMMLKI